MLIGSSWNNLRKRNNENLRYKLEQATKQTGHINDTFTHKYNSLKAELEQ